MRIDTMMTGIAKEVALFIELSTGLLYVIPFYAIGELYTYTTE
jgi:hypothetical protein